MWRLGRVVVARSPKRRRGSRLSAATVSVPAMTTGRAVGLSVRDHMRIQLADSNRGPWLQRAGRVRHELGETETAMWVRVNALLDDPAAVAAHPMEIARLRRRRDAQRAQRAQRRLQDAS